MGKSLSLFKNKKIRATPQRLAVYQVLEEKKGHLTAEEIYVRLKKKFSGLSLATVYAALENLRKKGLVTEVRIKLDRACFETAKGNHHHFLCRICDKIIDIHLLPCRAMKKMKVAGNLIEDLHGYFYGVCQDCKNKRKAK